MKILFWIPYPSEGASNRYRVEQYLPYLKEAGVDYFISPFWSKNGFMVLYKPGHFCRKIFFFIRGALYRIFDILQIYQYDAVFIHRESFPIGGAFFETILCKLKKPFIFDFDDAIFLPASSANNSFIDRFRTPDRVANIIRMSRHVIAGNQYLADFALKYNRNVSELPTPVETGICLPDNVRACNEVVIGWIGSITTSKFLETIKKVIISLSKKFKNVKFKIVGGDFCINDLQNIVYKQWRLKEEIEDLSSFDIGIMPMPDTEWTRGKCGFKAILYMSMGIPSVVSDVGMNREIIIDGQNGFLAKNEDDWFNKLSDLIRSRELRDKIGKSGKETIEQKYSVKVNAPKFVKILEKISNKPTSY